MKILAVFMVLSFPLLTLAGSPECFQGQWQINSRKSDNPERFLNKLERKQKEQQRAIYRADNREVFGEDLSLTDTLPRFIFLLQDLDIEIQPDYVVLRQPDRVRKVGTNDKRQSVSLKALPEHSETRVAGWDNNGLVIETTAIDGSRVTETFQLLDEAKTLHVDVLIKRELDKEMLMEKVYQREVVPAGCKSL